MSLELFYYVVCPHCDFDFAVSPYLGEKVELEGGMQLQAAINEDDYVKIYCPQCGKTFTFVPAKTRQVLIDFIDFIEDKETVETEEEE